MRTATRLALCAVLAGCNSILDNGDFIGPDDPAGCDARGLPPTTLTGTVFAPNQSLPINNALVYVPGAALADIPDGPSGPTCASGAPVATARSDTHGNFKLENVPPGGNVQLVIQVGKWRRSVMIGNVPACTTTAVDAALTRLPRDRSEGHIPHIAIATGHDDTLECLPRDLGIADSEITSGPSSTGRIRLYAGDGTAEFAAGGAFEPVATLTDPGTLPQYDAIAVGCTGLGPSSATAAGAQAMFDFANHGGWLWLSHGQFDWITRAPEPWHSMGSFSTEPTTIAPTTILVDQGSPQGQALADWLAITGASATAGALPVKDLRQACKSVNAPARRMMYLDPASGMTDVQMFIWDAAMAGRLVFADIHFAGDPQAAAMPYPQECAASPSPQDRAIVFELFDTPTCLP